MLMDRLHAYRVIYSKAGRGEGPASTFGSFEVVGTYIFSFPLVFGKEAIHFLTGKTFKCPEMRKEVKMLPVLRTLIFNCRQVQKTFDLAVKHTARSVSAQTTDLMIIVTVEG